LIIPPFSLIAQVFPKLDHMVTDLQNNKDNWRDLFEEYETKKDKGNPFEPQRLRWNSAHP